MKLTTMLRRLEDTQVNPIGSHCHSGMFVKAAIRVQKHPRFIAVAAILHDQQVRQRNVRMPQSFVEFLTRTRLSGIQEKLVTI